MLINNIEIEIIKNGFFVHNAYLIKINNNAIIIDPGSDFKKINKIITSQKLKITAVLITHGHYDHFACLNSLMNSYPNIKYYGSQKLNDVITNKKLHLGEDNVSIINIQQNYLKDGEIIEFNGIKIKAIATPGHLTDHMCYYLPDNNILFSGDVLFKNNIGTTRFPTGSDPELRQSLKKIFKICNEDSIIFPGHGPSSNLRNEKAFNPYLKFLS